MKTTKAYKLVQEMCGGLYSFNAVNDYSELAVKYVPGEVTTPKTAGTPLFVFKTARAARCWGFLGSNIQIWECEVAGLRPLTEKFKEKRNIKYTWAYGPLEKLWKGWKRIKATSDADRECFLASTVKLTKKIK
jgi:hypothetical protein